MRPIIASFVALGLIAFAPSSAHALGIGVSVGAGTTKVESDFHRSPTNIEVTPNLSLGLAGIEVAAELGVLYEVDKAKDFLLRPGVRAQFIMFYGRLAFPFNLTTDFDDNKYGVLIGGGLNVLPLGIVTGFVEVDVSSNKKFTLDYVSLEGRVGVRY